MIEQADIALQQRKARDRAIIIPIIGLMLLMPPIVGAFASPATILGVPVAVVYLFSVWAALIAMAYRTAQRLQNSPDSSQQDQGPGAASAE